MRRLGYSAAQDFGTESDCLGPVSQWINCSFAHGQLRSRDARLCVNGTCPFAVDNEHRRPRRASEVRISYFRGLRFVKCFTATGVSASAGYSKVTARMDGDVGGVRCWLRAR